MKPKPMLVTLLLGTLMSVSSLAGALAEPPEPAGNIPGEERMDMDHRGMKQGGMQGCGMMGRQGGSAMQGPMMRGGMMGMMGERSQMRSGAMIPQLPPGNEKLQLQMHAEMMQKMGEILGKYADRIKDDQGTAPSRP